MQHSRVHSQLLYINMQRFRGGLVFKAHRLCVSLNSRLESKHEDKHKNLQVQAPAMQHARVHFEREFFFGSLFVQVYFIIVMIGWTGLAPWEFEFPFPDSLTSTFLEPAMQHARVHSHT